MIEKKRIIRERAKTLADFGAVREEPASWMKEYADKAVEGLLPFDAGIWVKVGLKDIDWSGAQYPHVEWGQTLNRWPQIDSLASMYRKTRIERYAQTARLYLEDYIRHDPGFAARRKERSDTTLSVAIRIQRWETCLPAFLDSPSFDDEFVQSILDSVATQARELSQHLTGTNFRLAELDALVFTGLRLPFLPNAKELLAVGLAGMRANLGAQFLPDGVHVERTPGYHGGCVETMMKYVRLGRLFPEADAHVNLELLKRAIDYSALSSLSAFNDSGIAYRDPEEEHQRPEVRWARALRELMPNQQFGEFPPLEQAFPYAGHVFCCSAWKPGADYLAFDAGTWGTGHDHLSRLGFTFRAGGRPLVSDPGCFSYEMSDPMAIYGRSTPAHSTLNLNGLNQSNVDAQLIRAEFTSATAFMHGRYNGGYWPGRYSWGFGGRHGNGVSGVHDRSLFWVKGEYLVALDTMAADLGTSVHNVWQMGPMEGWEKDESRFAWWSKNKDENLLLQLIPVAGKVEMQCFEGSKTPLRGWVAKTQTETTPAPQVEFRYPCNDYVSSSAVLLVPFAGEQRPAYRVQRTGKTHSDETLCEIELVLPGGGADLIAWGPTLTTALESMPSSLNTDATFIWLRKDDAGKPLKGFVLDGSFATYQGKTIYEAQNRQTKLFAVAP